MSTEQTLPEWEVVEADTGAVVHRVERRHPVGSKADYRSHDVLVRHWLGSAGPSKFYIRSTALLDCGCPEDYVSDCGHQEGCEHGD